MDRSNNARGDRPPVVNSIAKVHAHRKAALKIAARVVRTSVIAMAALSPRARKVRRRNTLSADRAGAMIAVPTTMALGISAVNAADLKAASLSSNENANSLDPRLRGVAWLCRPGPGTRCSTATTAPA